jgi:hypothetical protein
MSFIDTNVGVPAEPLPIGVGTRTSIGGNSNEFPSTDAGITFEDWETLSIAMRRLGPFFMGHDVRSKESSRLIARDLLLALWAMGYSKPEPLEPLAPPENIEEPSAPTATPFQAGNTP